MQCCYLYVAVLPPTNVRAIVATSRSILTIWEPSSSSNVTGYLISYTTTALYASGGNVAVNYGNATSCTLTNLEEDTLYNITVQATTNDNRMSANDNKLLVKTYTDGKLYIVSHQKIKFYYSIVPTSSPQNVTLQSHDPVSLIVSWQPPVQRDLNGPIIGYVIQFTRVGSSSMMTVYVSNTNAHTLSGLVAYVNYSVVVAAMTVNGTGSFSNPPVVGLSGEDSKLN